MSGATEWFCGDDEKWHPRNPEFNSDKDNYPKCQLSN